MQTNLNICRSGGELNRNIRNPSKGLISNAYDPIEKEMHRSPLRVFGLALNLLCYADSRISNFSILYILEMAIDLNKRTKINAKLHYLNSLKIDCSVKGWPKAKIALEFQKKVYNKLKEYTDRALLLKAGYVFFSTLALFSSSPPLPYPEKQKTPFLTVLGFFTQIDSFHHWLCEGIGVQKCNLEYANQYKIQLRLARKAK